MTQTSPHITAGILADAQARIAVLSLALAGAEAERDVARGMVEQLRRERDHFAEQRDEAQRRVAEQGIQLANLKADAAVMVNRLADAQRRAALGRSGG